jgi:hypothetical protein
MGTTPGTKSAKCSSRPFLRGGAPLFLVFAVGLRVGHRLGTSRSARGRLTVPDRGQGPADDDRFLCYLGLTRPGSSMPAGTTSSAEVGSRRGRRAGEFRPLLPGGRWSPREVGCHPLRRSGHLGWWLVSSGVVWGDARRHRLGPSRFSIAAEHDHMKPT